MATVESNSDELVSMVFSAPIHLCPVLYPNKKEGEEHEEHEHHEHHEHQERTELKEHHHHHHHCDLIVEEENAEEHHELHKDEELSPEPLPEHRSQSPLSNCTSVSEPSVYPEENQHHQELHENVHHEIHVSEEHFKEHKHHEVHETEEAQHGHDEPDVPQPDHEPHHEEHHHHQHEHEHEIEVHHAMHCQDSLDEVENAFKDIEEHFSRPAGGFMLEIEHHSILSDEDGGDSHMSYDLHERREVNEDIVPAKSEEHDRVIQELKAQQLQHSRVPSEVGGYKVSCWHNSDAQDEYEPAEFVEHHHEHHKDHESDEELPEAVPRTSLNHQQAVEHHYDTQSEHETEHEHEYENHKQHRDAVLAYDSERVGLIRHERTFSQRSEVGFNSFAFYQLFQDLPVHEDAQREVSHAPGVRSLRNRFESGSLLNDDEVSVASRRSSLQTSVYEGRAREILQEVLGLSDDDTSQEVPDFSQHKRTSSVHSIDQTSLVSSRRSSTTFAPQKLAYTPPERGVTTPRSSNFNPEKFQSVRVVKSVRNQVLIWGGQELKPRHYSRRVSKVTNIGTVFEENQKVPQHLPSIEERRDSVFSSVSQPSRRTSNHVAAAESKRSSVSSVASRGTAAKSQASSRRTSVASTVTITDRKVAEKPVHQNFEYKPPVAKVEPASASSTMSYRHSATAKVPVSQRKSLFETEEIPSAKRNFIIVRKTTSTESNGNTSTTTAVKKTESNIGDWKKQVEAAF
ncbi:hypothetical protein L596_004052 [Steinernema carpocapsae]|uniref:Uncharacterized protein n=1 Tax=Steinernema carpocapsae TaxID=34508 RepID=A0A4U8UUM7_STECR|nr:hypothetical protein L596_004052 [Steinernema carpocapsae]